MSRCPRYDGVNWGCISASVWTNFGTAGMLQVGEQQAILEQRAKVGMSVGRSQKGDKYLSFMVVCSSTVMDCIGFFYFSTVLLTLECQEIVLERLQKEQTVLERMRDREVRPSTETARTDS